MQATRFIRSKKGLIKIFCLALAAVFLGFTAMPAMAQPPCYDPSGNVTTCEGLGGIRYNGTRTQPSYIRADSIAPAGVPSNWFAAPGFLFEPETPYDTLKSVPQWNEIEQLLDNPYAVAVDPNTPGNFEGYPSYRSTIVRRPNITAGTTLQSPGPPLPGLLVHPLNYNPTTGEEMRLLNPAYSGGPFDLPYQLVQCSQPNPPPACQICTAPNTPPGCSDATLNCTVTPTNPTPSAGCTDPSQRWAWSMTTVQVSSGAGRVFGPEIDYNGPIGPDNNNIPFCVANLELVPPEGTLLCGLDPGEPNYSGFGVLNTSGYSTPAVPGVASLATPIPPGSLLYDATRGGSIQPRDPVTGIGGLFKPSLRIPEAGGTPGNPNYLYNSAANLASRAMPGGDPAGADTLAPSNENDYVEDRNFAIVLGKAMFWDMQVGSDSVQSCGSCHFKALVDDRTKNQLNPNHLGGDLRFEVSHRAVRRFSRAGKPANSEVVPSDFPLHKLRDPNIAGDPLCTTPIIANVTNVVPALDHPVSGDVTVCDANNIISTTNDVMSSMGVRFAKFVDIPMPGPTAFVGNTPGNSVRADVGNRGFGAHDPIPAFQSLRRVEPRNTPSLFAAAMNFDNFWDGRARHDFNGGSVFGASDPQSHVFVDDAGTLTPTRQIIKFSSIASLATGPGLSEFEMSFQGRNWSKVGKKLLQTGATPLANQLVDPTDSVLGIYSNQGGSACAGLAPADLSGDGTTALGKPGLCISYAGLIRHAYYPALWQNTSMHLNGCYTDGNAASHPNQCAAGSVAIPVLAPATGTTPATVVNSSHDPFDEFVLTPAAGPAVANNTNQFTQMEANWSLFWGLSIQLWVQILMPDDTPYDQFLAVNPDAFMGMADTTEPLLVDDLVNCNTPGQRNVTAPGDPGYPMGACFTEVGNFKRDPGLFARYNCTAEGGVGCLSTPAGGTRTPTDPDPLLGIDIFFASNLSLKNPNFRSARCGACHNMPTLTDNTVPFTFKAQLTDFQSEFTAANPGVELRTEPLGRLRIISGFLLESEIGENGQDSVERRFINQSIAPNPVDGLAYPDGVFNPPSYIGAGQAFIDNGVYNLGVTPINNDIGRGGPDPFGWPLSLATLLLKNLGGPGFEPGNAMTTFNPSLGPEGGLFALSAQDQQINPGGTDEPVNPLLPPHMYPWAPGVVVGDAQPELDEPHAGINTLTDVAMLEGFIDVIGPVSPSAVLNEGLNMGESELMGTWPTPNRVIRDGAFKAPQLRNVELTAPYFHNGGQLTLRQVIDFYVRGGDFPITNAAHRDFNIVNLNLEAQSNLSEPEKVALIDFLLELTDARVKYEQGPFDHPEVFIPLDGTAPDNTFGRPGFLANLTNGMFRQVPAVGTGGNATPLSNFLGVSSLRRTDPGFPVGGISHYDSNTNIPLPGQQAPVANNDNVTWSRFRSAIAVLINDIDPDGTLDRSSINIMTSPAHGTVTVMRTGFRAGRVFYTPNAGYHGQDTFTYDVADNQGNRSNVATVTVTVP